MRIHTVYLHLLTSDSRHYATFERVYIRLHIFEMHPLIENPADCEIRSVIRYLSAKGMKAVEIRRNICEVYGQNMSDGMVRIWVRALKDGRKNVHDEERSGRSSVISDDLLQKIR